MPLATNSQLVEITSDLQKSLRDGKLSPADFGVVVECLGERGSGEVAAGLLKSKSARGAGAEAISLYFSAWSRKDADSAWNFAKKYYDGKAAESIQLWPPTKSPFPESVLKGLVRGTQDLTSPELAAIHNGLSPLADKFAMWQMEPLVRSIGFGGAVDAVKKGISGKASEELATGTTWQRCQEQGEWRQPGKSPGEWTQA